MKMFALTVSKDLLSTSILSREGGKPENPGPQRGGPSPLVGKGLDTQNMWWGKLGHGDESREGRPTPGRSERRDAGVLSLGHKAPAAFRKYRAPGALGRHLLRAEASNIRQPGVGRNELIRMLAVLSASCTQLLQSTDTSSSANSSSP